MGLSRFLKRFWHTGVVGTFLAGLFVLLPVVLTFVILNWIIDKIAAVLGPGSFLGDLVMSGGGTIIGPNHGTLSYLLGSALAITGIWFIGIVVKTQARLQINRAVDLVFERVPFVRAIYKPVSQVIRLFSNQEGSEFKGMSVVSCRFGSESSVDVLALVTSTKIFNVGGQRRRLVYLPTSPLPMSGALILVAEDQLVPMPQVTVDELMQTYFSMGVVSPASITELNQNNPTYRQ